MKIAFLHPSHPNYDGTGSTHSANRLIKGLIKSGHDVSVFCLYTPDSKTSDFDCFDLGIDWNLKNRTTKEHSILNGVKRFKNVIEKFDVFHAYMTDSVPALSYISRNTSTKTVMTVNSYLGICPREDMLFSGDKNCPNRSTKKCMMCIAGGIYDPQILNEHGTLRGLGATAYVNMKRVKRIHTTKKSIRLSENIDHVCFLSPHLLKKYSQSNFCTSSHSIIPNIIDPNFMHEPKCEFSEPYNLLYVGSLTKEKGANLLLDIFEQLEQKGSKDYKLKIVGDGTLKTYMVQRAEDLGLSKKVEFLGYMPYEKLPSIYSSSDIFIYPGKWDEPFARVFLEVIGATIPFVGSDVGDVKQVMGEGGVFVDGSIQDFCKSIINVSEAEKLAKMSNKLHSKQQTYTEEKVIEQYNSVYEAL